jgi:hypothetical protein
LNVRDERTGKKVLLRYWLPIFTFSENEKANFSGCYAAEISSNYFIYYKSQQFLNRNNKQKSAKISKKFRVVLFSFPDEGFGARFWPVFLFLKNSLIILAPFYDLDRFKYCYFIILGKCP